MIRFENIYFDFSKMIVVAEYYYEKDLEFTIREIPFYDFMEKLRLVFGNKPEMALVEEYENELEYLRESIMEEYLTELLKDKILI